MREEMERVSAEVGKVILGKEPVIRKLLTAMLAGGHILLDDVPGVGKTTLAVALSRMVGLAYRRIQFTPDVLPSDIVGFSIYDRDSGRFIYRPGVIHDANLLLGDEINRASSKTQSALLEAMEEGRITVDGEAHPLQNPFIVIATQNHVGTAGTQALPYAQMDRFMVRLSLGYPDHDAQLAMMRDRRDGNPMEEVKCVQSREAFLRLREEVSQVTVKDVILDYISRLSIATREDERFEVGISPRGALHMMRMAQSHAWMENRDYVTGGDVRAVFHEVWDHRVLPARGDVPVEWRAAEALESVLASVPVPDRRA